MIVTPEFLDHWKTHVFRSILNDDRAGIEPILRVWAHCQISKRFTFPSNWIMLAGICRWAGDVETLKRAFVESGYIVESGDEIVVHQWDTFNSSLIGSWKNGTKGGRPPKTEPKTEKPTGNPRVTHGLPTGYPAETHGLPTGNPQVTHGLPTANPRATHGVTDKIREDKRREDKKIIEVGREECEERNHDGFKLDVSPNPNGLAQPASKKNLADAEFLESLKANPAYDGIDVVREAAKAQVWCENNRCTLTRRRFINWLNRIEKPLNVKKQPISKERYAQPW